MREKEYENVEEYQNRAREVGKMWIVRAKVVLLVMGTLGSIPLRLSNNPGIIEMGVAVEMIQRCAFWGSTRILRKVLGM